MPATDLTAPAAAAADDLASFRRAIEQINREAPEAFRRQDPAAVEEQTQRCYRCQGPTTPGMLVERDHSAPNQLRWASGGPRAGVGALLSGRAVQRVIEADAQVREPGWRCAG